MTNKEYLEKINELLETQLETEYPRGGNLFKLIYELVKRVVQK
jgi:hypothetical protein